MQPRRSPKRMDTADHDDTAASTAASTAAVRPVRLTRDRIIAEAVAFADADGLATLTMRRLADRLGVGTMSLYNHVASKDDMIEGMVDAVCAEIDQLAGDDWRGAIRAGAASAHRVLLAHPWAAHEWSRRMPGPIRTGYMDAILRVLTDAGLSAELVYRGYHAITMHIVGFTTQELGYLAGSRGVDLDALATGFVADLESGGRPHLAEHVRAHLCDTDHGDEFGFALDLILDGLDRAR